MKKIKLYALAAIALVILSISVFAFQEKPVKTYDFKFTKEQVEAIWYLLDNSTASHNDVKTVQKWISEQYNKQLADTTSAKKPK